MPDFRRHNPERAVTPAFLDRVASWIESRGEVLVVLRYLAAAGAKDFLFCRTRAEFEAVVGCVPVGTDVEVFRDPQLPMRGIVTEQFVAQALQAAKDGEEYLVIPLYPRTRGANHDLGDREGMSHAELREHLAEFRGEAVALGKCPAYHLPDSDVLISAAKGGVDGPR